MWCSRCQQETPGVAHATTGRIVCSRCRQPVRQRNDTIPARVCDEGIPLDEQPAVPTTTATPLPGNDPSAEKRARSLARELNRPALAQRKPAASMFSERLRFEPPHDLFSSVSSPAAPATAAAPPAVHAVLHTRRTEASQMIAWLIVAAGGWTLVGGLGVIGWSLAVNQMPYWNLALGLALGGQGTLILGLVLVVSRLWRHSRFAAGKLQDVQTRLGQLQQTAEILTTMRSGGGAPAFYAELARGASPHVLLTNLKGQLDQLATRLGSRF